MPIITDLLACEIIIGPTRDDTMWIAGPRYDGVTPNQIFERTHKVDAFGRGFRIVGHGADREEALSNAAEAVAKFNGDPPSLPW